MKLLSYYKQNQLYLGIQTEKGILAVSNQEQLAQSMEQLLAGGQDALTAISDFEKKVRENKESGIYEQEDQIAIAPPITNPSKIICVGLNYRKHAEESNMSIPSYPILFNKYNNSLTADKKEITIPEDVNKIDYEAELTIVIGKTAKNISEEEALEYVLGYCNANDVSARDLQMRTNQWLLGKSCDGFCPIGPYLVTSDEVSNPNDLQIQCYVNGELRQNSNTSDMIFSCKEIISYISQYMTLCPGDIILTGTPQGVIMGYPEGKQPWLQSGDEISVEIEKLGKLTNRMKSY